METMLKDSTFNKIMIFWGIILVLTVIGFIVGVIITQNYNYSLGEEIGVTSFFCMMLSPLLCNMHICFLKKGGFSESNK
jgi:hypothetical protein